MKKTLILFAILLAVSAVGSAAPLCRTFHTLQDLLIAANSDPNFACENQDKLFSNWEYMIGNGQPNDAAALASAESISAISSATPRPGGDIHGWSFINADSWTTSFTLHYVISVLPAFPDVYIRSNEDQFNLAFDTSGVDTQVPDVGSPVVLNPTSSNLTVTSVIGLAKSVSTTSVVTIASGGSLSSYEQQWFEYETPEPGSIALFMGGAGLIGLGMLRRKR
jgi:hypothetical protein